MFLANKDYYGLLLDPVTKAELSPPSPSLSDDSHERGTLPGICSHIWGTNTR